MVRATLGGPAERLSLFEADTDPVFFPRCPTGPGTVASSRENQGRGGPRCRRCV